MAQAPEISGGAGFSFEDASIALYLAALLGEESGPGLPDRTIVRVALQQAAFGEPLDDLIVDGIANDETRARLSLQVKRALTISSAASNSDFREIVSRASATVAKPEFREDIDRVGAVTGTVADAPRRALVEVCEWARGSESLTTFLARFEVEGFAGEGRKAVLDAFREILTGGGDADVYKVLRHFVFIKIDVLHEGATDEVTVIERLRPRLHQDDAHRAGDLWARLLSIARAAAGRATEFSRASLVRDLHGAFRLGGARSLAADLDRINEEARLSLANIPSDIAGTKIERRGVTDAVQERLQGRRLVQLVGLPGTGKSVALRAVAEFMAQRGTVLVLKSDRLTGPNWAAYARSLGLSAASIESLLTEIGATGSAILFIDGIDRVEIAHRGIILDLIQTILASPLLENWKMVVTLRDNGIEPLRTWLPPSLLDDEGVGSVEVKPFDDEEATQLADATPALRPLLFGDMRVRDIARRPFFASVLARALPEATPGSAPRSEIELIAVWWKRGGYNSDEAQAIHRQRALVALAKSGATTLGRRVRLDTVDLDAMSSLKRDGVIKDVSAGHAVQFTHDIFFEWSFVHLLIDREDAWIEEIQAVGEPPVLGRAVELFSQAMFSDFDRWEATLGSLEAACIRPQWTRAWLTGPFSNSTFADLADKFTEATLRDDGRRLGKLAVWFQAEKTRANPQLLDRSIGSTTLSPREIIRAADVLAWPSDVASWNRFCRWMLGIVDRIPAEIIPDVISAFEVWQNLLTDYPNEVSVGIVAAAHRWLEDLEDREHPEEFRFEPGPWGELSSGERRELEDRLRSMVLRSARVEVDRVHAYLERVRTHKRLRHHAFQKILAWTGVLATHHAQDVVNLCLTELKGDLPAEIAARPVDHRSRWRSFSHHDWRELAIRHASSGFFPASPLREPFNALFQNSPEHALALCRELTNHAITAWRQLHEVAPDDRATPIPLLLDFPWGQQSFWGDARIYQWARGHWAPGAVVCGLMALEKWAFEEIGRGRNVDEVIRDVVSGHDACAVLCIAAVVAMENNHVSEATLPIATSQRLWHWDIQRLVGGESSANLIGFMRPNDLPHAQAVRASNDRASRRFDIRWLAQLFVVTADDKLREAAHKAIQSFPDVLPFDYEEESGNDERVASLKRTAEIWCEVGKIENYRATSAPDGSGTVITVENPTAADPDVVEAAQRSARMNERFGVVMWVSDSLEKQIVSPKLPLNEAIERAKALDRRDLYAAPHNSMDMNMDQSVVAGVAAVVARYVENPGPALLEWSAAILFRAYQTKEKRDELWFAGSALLHHPCLFSVPGLEGLVRHGLKAQEAKAALLTLAGHPLEAVSEAALSACLSLWDYDANLAWIALNLGIRLSTGSHDEAISAFGYDHTTEPKRVGAAVQVALNELKSGKTIETVQALPAPWVFAPPRAEQSFSLGRKNEQAIWRDPDEFLRWDFLPKIFPKTPIEGLMIDPTRRQAFLGFCYGLLDWTLERLNPSWQSEEEKRNERHSSADLFEWRVSLARFLASVALHLEPEETQERILDPMFALEDETAASLIHPFADWITRVGIFDPKEISPRAIALMTSCLGRVLRDHSWRSARRNDGDLFGSDVPLLVRLFLFVSVTANGDARFANDDWREIGVVMPIIDAFVREVGDIPSVMSAFLTLSERAIDHYPAATFVDQVTAILQRHERTPVGWRDTTIAGRLAGLIHTFAEHSQPLATDLAQAMLRVLDRLVDMGDRRSAALQSSEIFKNVRL
jgi:hypothetical protein